MTSRIGGSAGLPNASAQSSTPFASISRSTVQPSVSGPDKEQRAAMLTVAVQEYIADVRPVFGECTA
jgi:hypothetical protein